MFYFNDKFCCMCLYESFILKLTNYDEAQPSQQGLFPQSSLCSISLPADMRWVGICRNPTRQQSARVVTGIRTQTASLSETSFPVRRLLRHYLICHFIKHGWFGPHHDHGLQIHRASRQLSSTSAPLARVFTHCLLTDLNRHTMITNHQCYHYTKEANCGFTTSLVYH